jgi:hypothetical protein
VKRATARRLLQRETISQPKLRIVKVPPVREPRVDWIELGAFGLGKLAVLVALAICWANRWSMIRAEGGDVAWIVATVLLGNLLLLHWSPAARAWRKLWPGWSPKVSPARIHSAAGRLRGRARGHRVPVGVRAMRGAGARAGAREGDRAEDGADRQGGQHGEYGDALSHGSRYTSGR